MFQCALRASEREDGLLWTLTEDTVATFSFKPVSWAQGWSSGKLALSPLFVFLFLSMELVLPPGAQHYQTAPGPHCEASLKLITTTVY